MEIGVRVRVLAGNAAGKTGIVRALADDGLVVVESESTGHLRRFASDLLEVEAMLPSNGSGATPMMEAVLPSNGSGATPLRLDALRGEVEGVLPYLENLRDRLCSGNPLSRGWLNDESRRMRYCYRNEKGVIVCTRVRANELSEYRDRLQLGRVLVALDQVIRFLGGS